MGDLKNNKLGRHSEILKNTVGHPYITPQKLRRNISKEDKPRQGETQDPCGSRT